MELDKKYSGAKFVITLYGETAGPRPLNRDPLVKKKWENVLRSRPVSDDAVMGQCSISGKYGQIACIHNSLTGIPDGLATGVNIVCLKSPAFWSYDRRESYNSSVSQEVMEKYTKAFNYLTSAPNHMQTLDGMTLLYWAMTKKSEKPYINTFNAGVGFNTGGGFFNLNTKNPAEAERNKREMLEKELTSIFNQLAEGKEADWKSFGIDGNTEFYILGVKPNSSRLAIKIFEHNKFGNMMANIAKHYEDMQLSPSDKQMPSWLFSKALKSPIASKNVLPPDLSVKILHSILSGVPYPRCMLEMAVRRTKTDHDGTDKKTGKKFYAVSRDRVRIIKACLTRVNIIKRGELKMLNTQNKEGAYNCGRLFAVLEMIQQAANPDINATIKDKFFSSACSTRRKAPSRHYIYRLP